MDEATARQHLYPHADTIICVFEAAWSRYRGTSLLVGKRSRASIVHDFVTEEAELAIASRSGVRMIRSYGVPIYVIDDSLGVRLKKHANDKRTANVMTLHQNLILNQQLTLGGLPPVTYVSAGYVLDSTGSELRGLGVSKWIRGVNGPLLEWWVDLRELAAGQLSPVAPALPFAPPPALPLPAVGKEGVFSKAEQTS